MSSRTYVEFELSVDRSESCPIVEIMSAKQRADLGELEDSDGAEQVEEVIA